MPSPVTSADFNIVNPSGDVCAQLSQLLATTARLKEWFAWAVDDGGNPTDDFITWLSRLAPPVGSIQFMPVNTVPAGYLLCNGQAVSRTTYAVLFSVIGTQQGIGDGTTTFNVPDLQRKVLFGAGGPHVVGDEGGEETHVLTEAELASHVHRITAHGTGIPSNGNGFLAGGNNVTGPFIYDDTTFAAQHLSIERIGSDQPHNCLPPYQVGLWVVKF